MISVMETMVEGFSVNLLYNNMGLILGAVLWKLI